MNNGKLNILLAWVRFRFILQLSWILLFSFILLLFCFKASYACRLYAIMFKNSSATLLEEHLLFGNRSLKTLSNYHNNGWGIAWFSFSGSLQNIERGAIKAAATSSNFSNRVEFIARQNPKIVVAHIRKGTSGCGGKVKNPHPFHRRMDGKEWIFAHNGSLNKATIQKIISDQYLKKNYPNGSGIEKCIKNPVDSEFYFILLLKNIKKSVTVIDGIVETVHLLSHESEKGSMNFVLSDGINIWALRNRINSYLNPPTLYYIYDDKYSAVASSKIFLPGQGKKSKWIELKNHELVILTNNQEPTIKNIQNRINMLCNDY